MNKDLDKLKVAIVCDWLLGIGGAERVVLELHKMFPKAPIYTSQYNPKTIDWFKNAEVRTSRLMRYIPSSLHKFSPVLRALYFSHLNLSEYDLIISSSGAEAKFVKFKSGQQIHLTYCHAPTHYYWMRYNYYLSHPGFGNFDWLARIGLKMLVSPMRSWDRKAAQRPTSFIANSEFTKQQIKKYYGRDSIVIHPPVNIDRFKKVITKERSGFVVVGRQTPYKRIDLAVLACTRLGLPLAVVGNGPEHEQLIKLAGPTIKFVTGAADREVAEYVQSAEGLIFPGLDDFGITAAEALAAGTPVIAYNDGGSLDYMENNVTGKLFNDLSVNSLMKSLRSFKYTNYDSAHLRAVAGRFSEENFRQKLEKFIQSQV